MYLELNRYKSDVDQLSFYTLVVSGRIGVARGGGNPPPSELWPPVKFGCKWLQDSIARLHNTYI